MSEYRLLGNLDNVYVYQDTEKRIFARMAVWEKGIYNLIPGLGRITTPSGVQYQISVLNGVVTVRHLTGTDIEPVRRFNIT